MIKRKRFLESKNKHIKIIVLEDNVMSEEKQKDLGIIMRSAKVSKQKETKKLYTIISCCVSVVFLLSVSFAFFSKDEQKESAEVYNNISYDLSDLPVEDEEEHAFLNIKKYKDIFKKKIKGGLFSKKQKEARQKKDKEEGLYDGPDEEYRTARREKRATKNQASRPAYTTRNSSGSLSKGGMVSTSGGSSGVSGSTWSSRDKTAPKPAPQAKTGNNQLVASVGKGKAATLLRAIEESKKGADSNDADISARAVADAFTNNNLEAEDGDLKEGMDEFADQFNAEAFKGAVNNNDLTDLKNEAEKAKKKKEEEGDPCKSTNKTIRMECKREQFIEKMMETLLDAAVGIATAYIKGGKSGSSESGKDGKSDFNYNRSQRAAQEGAQAKDLLDKYDPGKFNWQSNRLEIFGGK